jgi:hypothetical protein
MPLSTAETHTVARFWGVSEMKQNPARFVMSLSIIWRIKSNTIKYCDRWLSAIEMRA